MEKTWKPARGKYTCGEELWIGKIPVASWFNPVRSKGDPTAYRAQIDLPGIAMKKDRIEADSADEIKARIERVVDTWFKWLEVENQPAD